MAHVRERRETGGAELAMRGEYGVQWGAWFERARREGPEALISIRIPKLDRHFQKIDN